MLVPPGEGTVRRRRIMSRNPAKTRHASTTKSKRNHTPTAGRPATPTLADLQQQVSALTRELVEAREQQTATADVLKVISRSTFDLQAVFETVLENAVRLCKAERSFIFLFDGKVLRAAASCNTSPELREFIERNPVAPGRHSAAARVALERRTVHIPDVQADPEYTWGVKQVEPLRTLLGVPMLKGDELVGVIITQKREVKP